MQFSTLGEASFPKDQIKLVHANELYHIPSLPKAWAITFETKPTGVNIHSDSNLFYFTQKQNEDLQPLPGVFVKKGTTIFSICFLITGEVVCHDKKFPLNTWSRITIGQVPEITYPYLYKYKAQDLK